MVIYMDFLSVLIKSLVLKDCYSPELFKDLKGSIGVYVFFKEGEEVPVIAHCPTNNTVLELDSLSDAAKLVGATNSSALLTFMLKEKPYKASNGNMYVIKYKNKADYDKALMQLEKRLEATRKWKAPKKS